MTITELPQGETHPPSQPRAEHGLGKGSGDTQLDCPEEGCTFVTFSPAGLQRHITRQHPRALPPAGGTSTGTAEEEEPDEPEQPPRPPRASSSAGGGLFGRLRDRVKGATAAKAKPAKPAKAKVSRNRISVASDLATAWYGIGRRMESTPHYPAGRMMAYQAPAAGVVIDRALDGSLLDRMVVQPLWRTKDQWEDVFYLAAPPILLVSMQNARMRAGAALEAGDNETAARIDGWVRAQGMMLEQMLRASLLKIAPAMAEAKERAAAEDEIIREAFPDLGDGIDPVQALLSDLFAPPPWAGPQPTPEEAEVE